MGTDPPCLRESQNPQSQILCNSPFCSSLKAWPVTLQMNLLQVLIRWPHWLSLPAVCLSSPVVLILRFCSNPMASYVKMWMGQLKISFMNCISIFTCLCLLLIKWQIPYVIVLLSFHVYVHVCVCSHE